MNKKEFYVGQFRIDMTRNQVIAEGDILSMEPKVLEVLVILAEHQGEVVSHQEIADKIWPDAVVVPNALQRCIAQLRKAFGDDAKQQSVIVTHPKKGYSLIADVSWKKQYAKQAVIPASHFTQYISIGIAIVLALSFVWLFMQPSSTHQLFNQLTPLTSTDKPEYFSSFSPNGRYVAFTRHRDKTNHNQADLWLRDLHENREFQITKLSGHAGEPSWSPNGERIAFILDIESNNQSNSAVYSLYLPLAQSTLQTMEPLYSCNGGYCNSVQWLTNEDVAFVLHSKNHSKIIQLNTQNQTLTTLFEQQNTNIYSLDYSTKRKQLAMMMLKGEIQHQLLLLNPFDGTTEEVPFQPGKGNDFWKRWVVTWNANHNGFLTSSDSSLLHVSLTGEIVEQPIPTYKYVLTPEYHPNGDSIAITLGYIDRDINEISWQHGEATAVSVLNRSFRRESLAQYQPFGEGISFISDRSGKKQLWYSAKGNLVQLSDLKTNETIVHYTWSPDGKKLAVLINEQLYLTDLLGNWQKVQTQINTVKLFQWYNSNSLLLATIENNNQQLITLNLTNNHINVLHQGRIKWSQIGKDNQVYFSDAQGIIKQFELGNSANTTTLSPHKSTNRFWYKENALYWLSPDNTLWSLPLEEQHAQPLFKSDLPELAFGDIEPKLKKVLVTRSIAANKEIVLLHN